MKTVEIEVRSNGNPNDPWYVAYMTIEINRETLKTIKRFFVRKEETNEDGEIRTTMVREYKTRNALMNYMRKLPNN